MKENCKKWSLYVVIALLVVIGLPLATTLIQPNNTSCDYPEIAARGVLHVGLLRTPLSYHVENDTISGYDYELLQMLGRQSGLEIKLGTESCLAHCLQQLNKGRYDIIAYSTPATGDMKQMYLLSTPTSLNKHVLIQRTDTALDHTIRNQLDLCGCTLHIAQNDPARLRIENLAQEIGETIYICEKHHYDATRLIQEVANGTIDYAVCDEVSASMIAPQYNNIDHNTDIGFTQPMSWIMPLESTTLCDSINSWLSTIQEGEEFRKLYTRYFSTKSYNKQQRVNKLLPTALQDYTPIGKEAVTL